MKNKIGRRDPYCKQRRISHSANTYQIGSTRAMECPIQFDNGMISVILPIHNEEKILKKNVKSLEATLTRMFDDFEIILSEDGSTDKSPEIVKSLKSKRVRILQNGKRMGKGAAIRYAASYANGNIIMFMDADLATNPEKVKELVKLLNDGAAIVIGSRYHRSSRSKRTLLRLAASKSFNFLVKLLLGSKLSDHQCGFKAFRKDLILPILNKVENKNWFWDTELLIRAQRSGLRVDEIPIEWSEAPESKFRLLKDTYHMARSLASFKLRNG